MSLFTIADLHLAGKEGKNKSMEVFGNRWIGGVERLTRNWNAVISEKDTIILPGDFSWAMNLDEATDDLALLNSLPGTKYLGKGNHDFWWATASKMYNHFRLHGFDTLRILYNNSVSLPEAVICGSRGWFADEANQKTVGDVSWKKITDRETQRLRISLDSAADPIDKERIVFLHFPPIWNGAVCTDILELLHEHDVRRCFYGHIHGVYSSDVNFEYEGIRFELVSADYLDFCPKKVL